MEASIIFGIIANLIGWPLIIYLFWGGYRNGKEILQNQKEYYSEENQFKRRTIELGLTLEFFSDRYKYPYIQTPTFDSKKKATFPTILDANSEELIQPVDMYGNSTIRKGRFEFKFYSRLLDKYGIEIIKYRDYKLRGFFPDITYMDNANRIFIDIEIDEPYALKSKEPIHYYKLVKDQGILDSNKKRDEVFVNNGWTVIRFSEDQIEKDMEACLQLVDHLVCYWNLKKSEYNEDILKSLLHNRWTLEESRLMAIKNVRKRE